MIIIEDKGVVLSCLKYSENSLIVRIFSENNGLMVGFVKGALSRRRNVDFQVGNLVDFTWKSKNEDALGYFNIELNRCFFADIFGDFEKMSILNSLLKLIIDNVLEREIYKDLFDKLFDYLRVLVKNDDFYEKYLEFEFYLMKILGYEIDLSCCVVCGRVDDLGFVSPKSAKAVCIDDAKGYEDKLLKIDQKERILDYFWQKNLYFDKKLPVFRK